MNNPFDLGGHVALITGGNGGIGLGMAQMLASAGADVVIWGTNKDKNDAARAALDRPGRRVLVDRVDLSEEAQIVDGVVRALAAFGRIDSVFANAGINSGGVPFLETDAAAFDKVIDINLNGTFFLFREAVRHMVARAERADPGGSLVVTSSVSGIRGFAKSAAYSASKAALMGLVRSLAVEHGRHGIRANAIIPGFVDTDLIMPSYRTRFDREILPRVPVGRWGTGEDFGGIALYLASAASSFHTGDSFTLDGGYTLT